MTDQQRALFGTEPDPDAPLAISGRCGVCNAERKTRSEWWYTVEEWNEDTKPWAPRLTVCSRICLVAFAERGAMP